MTTSTHRWDRLQQAMATLSAACDYANAKDGTGFSSADASLGHYLGDTPAAEWDMAAADVAATFATKYKRQLGINSYRDLIDADTAAEIAEHRDDLNRDAIRDRAAAKRSADKVSTASTLTVDGDLIKLVTPYNAALIEAQRAIKGRQWDGSANTFPLSSLPQIVEMCDRFNITVADDIRTTAADIAAAPAAYAPVAVTLDEEGTLVIRTDYNSELNTGLRLINGRSTWDPRARVHRIEADADPQGLIDLFAAQGLKVDDSATAHLQALADALVDRPDVELDGDAVVFRRVPDDATAEDFAKELITAAGGTRRYPRYGLPDQIPVNHSPAALLDIITRHGLTIADDARAALEAQADIQAANLADSVDDGSTTEPVVIDGLGVTLMPHQHAAVRYLARVRRAILGDEMGLGKTISALATVAAENAFPAVVTCKPDLIGNWNNEIAKVLPGRRVYVAEGMTAKPIPADAEIILIGFNALGAKAKNPTMALPDGPTGDINSAARIRNPDDVAAVAAKVAERLTKSGIDHRGTNDALIVQTDAPTAWVKALSAALPDLRVRTANPGDADIVVAREQDTKLLRKNTRYVWADAITALNPAAFIIDEGHFGKEATAARSKGMEQVGRDVATRDGIVLNLTGTAIVNRPRELAQQLVTLGYLAPQNDRSPQAQDDYLFGQFGAFLFRYCGPEQSGEYGWTFNGASHLDELHTRLRAWGLYMRRLTDVLHDLPTFTLTEWTIDPSDLDQVVYAEYLAHEADTIEELQAAAQKIADALGVKVDSPQVKARLLRDSDHHLARITQLRQIIGEAKLPAIKKWVTAKNADGEKVMVAGHFRPVVSDIARTYGGLRIQGEQTVRSKEADKARFQEQSVDDAPVIAVSIAAGGTGHTLTAARYGIQAEQVWSPGEVNQMAKRMYRIGQTRDVEYTVALVPGTIDDRMWTMINDKQTVVSAVLDGEVSTGDQASTDTETTALGEVIWDFVTRPAIGTGTKA